MAEMELQQQAVRILLKRLLDDGIERHRNAKWEDGDPFRSGVLSDYDVFDGNLIHEIGRKPAGAFPKGKILLTEPPTKEKAAVQGYWLRWNFNEVPHEFRLFFGLWFRAHGRFNFNGYRFDAPEVGEEHDFYHCQPCRNFGDGEPIQEAALVSERIPAIPVNASNIVELTVCGLMAAVGRKKMKTLFHQILSTGRVENEFLRIAYQRCVKDMGYIHAPSS